MDDKLLKNEISENGKFKNYREQRFSYFQNGEYEKIDSNLYFDDNGEQFTDREIKACQQMKEARKKQISKIRNHFIFWLNNNYDIYFMTFTYDDKKRKKGISKQTLKKYCINALNDFDDYIINVDYGKENERIHFHALGAMKKNKKQEYEYIKRENKKGQYFEGKKLINNNLKDYENKVGFYDAELCKDDETSAKKLSRYIDKLTLHSVKVKQSYVSVKKGTEYQSYKEYKNNYNKEFKKIKEYTRVITIDDMLETHKKYKNYLNIENYCEIEYQFLLEKQKEKERKQKYINELKTRPKIKEKIFNTDEIWDFKYKQKQKEIREKLA